MDVATFWAMIETARMDAHADIKKQTELLIERLSTEPEEEIKAFGRILHDMQNEANRGELWDVAAFIHCGCGNDGFMDFRSWLIAQGEHVFRKAVEDPDSLADVVEEDNRDSVLFERFGYVAYYAYERRKGSDMPIVPGEYGGDIWQGGDMHEEEEYPQLFPRLAAKLSDCDEWWDNQINQMGTEQ